MITAYFDADGIFDAATDHRFSPPPAEQTGWDDWHPITVPGAFPGYWSRELVDAVNRIAGLPGVTCKWLTSWEEQAPLQLAPAIGASPGGLPEDQRRPHQNPPGRRRVVHREASTGL